MKKYNLAIIGIIFLFLNCESNSNNKNSINDNQYNNKDLGWEMMIPDGWMESNERTNKNMDGNSTLNGNERASLNIYNGNSSFQSIYFKNVDNKYQKIDFKKEKIENYERIKNFGFEIDSSEIKIIKINNKIFYHYRFEGSNSYGYKIISNSFSGKINDYQLNIGINCVNISDDQILESFLKSKFK